MTEPNPPIELITSEKGPDKTLFKVQREELGIPGELDNKPVLYLSSHRGELDTRYASHLEIFRKTLEGQTEENEDEESEYIDLSLSTPDQVVESLREVVLRNDPSKDGNWLSSNTLNNDPLPGFSVNIVYLPKLDRDGKSKEPSVSFTFGANSTNPRSILTKLKEFLEDKSVLDK